MELSRSADKTDDMQNERPDDPDVFRDRSDVSPVRTMR
jgi:hypothetical protein